MSVTVGEMLKISLDALVNKNAVMARTVLNMDDDVDKTHNSMYEYVQEKSIDNTKEMGQWFYVLSISRYLERIADHTTNISEDVIYMVEGEIALHGYKS